MPKIIKQNQELHLIILWANARYKESEIVADIKKHVDILDVYDVHWSCERVAENFSRFYGVNLPNKSGKEKECGITGFLLLVVRDNNPKYDFVETSRGSEKVNINIFSLKQKYRSWTGGGHKIHTTNSINETNHDACLLLGLNYKDLQKSLPEQWNGNIKTIYRDLVGTGGWNSLEELFYVLNATSNYVVLRNAEILPNEFKSTLHGDIDILTDNYENIKYIVNAKSVFQEDYRVHNKTLVSGTEVRFDFRYVGDDYYCRKFEEELLNTRILNDEKIYVLKDDMYFTSLCYHALIHKQVIASDYYDKIYNLFVKLGLNKKYNLKDYANPFDLYFYLLEQFMIKHNYMFVRPYDKSVFFSDKFINISLLRNYLSDKCAFRDVRVYHADIINDAYNIFLTADDEFGNRLFIKTNNISGLSKNEYHNAKKLYEIDNIHFIKPMYYHDDPFNCDDTKFVAITFTDAPTLRQILNNQKKLTSKHRLQMYDDILAIHNALIQSGIVHRDIRPENLIYHKNHLVLIDFQLSVDYKKYRELNFLSKNIKLLHGLGTDEFRYQQFQWDDSYSLLKVLECVGSDDGCYARYNDVLSILKNSIGKMSVTYRCKLYYIGIIKRNIYNMLSKILPIKSWRNHYIEKYKRY